MDDKFSESDRHYISLLQENINRMASNSANCKTWLVTLTTGLLAVGASIESLNGWLFLTLLPIFVFWSMDAYYLKLERGLRNRERLFINIVKSKNPDKEAYSEALFNFRPYYSSTKDEDAGIVETEMIEWSESVLPFYLMFLLIAVIVAVIVMLIH